MSVIAAALVVSAASLPVSSVDWTPHTAADLLDTDFASAAECQRQLDKARKSHAPAVEGFNYHQLFAQGRCEPKARHGSLIYRIRMHWPRINDDKENSTASTKPDHL